MKLKKRNTSFHKYYLLIILIIIDTYTIINLINDKLMPHIENIITISVSKSLHNNFYYMFDEHTLGDVNLTDIIHLTKNEEGEVLTIDYRYDIAYEYLSKSMNSFYEKVGNISIDIPTFQKNNDIIFLPLGIIKDNNVLFHNIGFKIPIKINLLNDISMKFKTKISEYGINNLLVELYIIVRTNNNFLSPNNYYSFSEENELLIASKIVIGKLPIYYNSQIEKDSTILTS